MQDVKFHQSVNLGRYNTEKVCRSCAGRGIADPMLSDVKVHLWTHWQKLTSLGFVGCVFRAA